MPANRDRALAALIVLAVPVLLVGNAVWVLLGPWTVEAQYALPGFPVDSAGVQDPARTELAEAGVDSVRPIGGGTEQLREARLPDGAPAFTEREIDHMADVRSVMSGLLSAWLVTGAMLVASLLLMRRSARARVGGEALLRGALLTIAAMAVLGLAIAVAFDPLFDGFHGLLFADGTWRFDDRLTLRQVYPDAFWGVAAGAVTVLVAVQAALVALLGRRLRSAPRPAARAA